MTELNFITLCNELLIDPSIALENVELKEALKEHNDKEVERILKEEF